MAQTQAISNPFLSEMARGNDEVLVRARELERILGPKQLDWQPPTGGWSAGQVFEHLIRTAEPYTSRFEALMTRARTQGRVSDRPWRPSRMGGMIMRAVHPGNERRSRAAKVFEPGVSHRRNVVRAFVAVHERLDNQIRNADGLDLRAIRLSSPASLLIRMNIGDAIGILVLHAQRHLLQVGRIMASEGYPEG